MQGNLILHIGRHKTGTTSLQKFFSANEALLLSTCSLLYPRTGRTNNFHHPIFRPLIHDQGGLDQTVIAELKQEIDASGAKTVLLSSELLSLTKVTREHLRSIRQTLADFSIRIVVYLRGQDDYLESSYAEAVKRGQCTFPQRIHSFDFGLDYGEHIEKYADVFGTRNLCVRTFETSDGFDVYRDFMTAIGCPWHEAYSIPPRRLNARYPWLYIEVLRYANLTGPTKRLFTGTYARRLFLGLGKHFPRQMDFPRPLRPEDKAALMRRYERSNCEIAHRYLDRDRLFD